MELSNNIYAAFALLAFIVVLVVVYLQYRTIGALTGAVKDAGNNKPFLDTIERVAVQVVPAELVTSLNKGADFLETFTTAEQKALVEAFRGLLNKVTDGQPNDPPANG